MCIALGITFTFRSAEQKLAKKTDKTKKLARQKSWQDKKVGKTKELAKQKSWQDKKASKTKKLAR